MGKTTDKMYITGAEWKRDFGGCKTDIKSGSEFKKLPFSHCSLTFTPFEHPVCTEQGVIFDLLNIIPWIKKHGTNPVDGSKLQGKQLIKLNFSKNSGGEYQCPITFKVFSPHTHIVAIKTSGNVYEIDSVEQLNIKTRNWKDLLTDQAFTRKDIITIQDPHNSRNILEYDFVRNGLEVREDKVVEAEKDPLNNINAQGTTTRIFEEMAQKKVDDKSSIKSFVGKQKRAYNEAHFSTGLSAYSLTSMSFTPSTKNIAAIISDEEYLFANIQDKAYIQIKTNYGDMNFELYCKEAPRASYNMIQLAKKSYYNDTTFHRSIRGFMLQGGDPTGTGKGGESYRKTPFIDEFSPALRHDRRGILSMANKGPNTNTSQFFITYGVCPHLDDKHTIFGHLVNGSTALDSCEGVGTSTSDAPLTSIKIHEIVVFTDPFDLLMNKDNVADNARRGKVEQRKLKETLLSRTRGEVGAGDEIGKYMKSKTGSHHEGVNTSADLSEYSNTMSTKKVKSTGFDNW